MSGKQEKCKKPQTSQLKDYDYTVYMSISTIYYYHYYHYSRDIRLTLI